jgi:hypothetical protein
MEGSVEARRMDWLEWKRGNHQGSWGSPAREELGFRPPGSRHSDFFSMDSLKNSEYSFSIHSIFCLLYYQVCSC